ncbi:hypothetical protein M0804_004076 [Polistes exclamans]|nr:hypothetical protein M0804_004076 [Polistes exclamans]
MNDTSLSESQEKAGLTAPPNQSNKDEGGGGGSRWFVPPIATTTTAESTFESLALDVSYAGLDMSGHDLVDHATSSYRETRDERRGGVRKNEIQGKTNKIDNKEDDLLLWDDIGVVEYLEKKLGPPDESTPEERVEVLKEVLAETDIHEGDGDLSDFLFHVARTKYGRIYIRVIRTLLLNRVSTVSCHSKKLSFYRKRKQDKRHWQKAIETSLKGLFWCTLEDEELEKQNWSAKLEEIEEEATSSNLPLPHHHHPHHHPHHHHPYHHHYQSQYYQQSQEQPQQQQQEEEEESQDDDPYEYDEDIRPSTSSVSSEFDSTSDNYENEVARVLRLETYYSQTGSVPNDVPTTRISAPCWDCKSCVEGTPLFLLGSPTDTPCTCISWVNHIK